MENGRLGQIKLDSYKPLRELVCDRIREAIISGVFAPGERLMEMQLAEEMGVSRTPVREAIRKLEIDGLIVMIPRRGTYVANISIKDINDVYEIRTALDELAAGLAAERMDAAGLAELKEHMMKTEQVMLAGDYVKAVTVDTQFHDVIYRAARNERLMNMVNNLREQITGIRGISMRYPGRLAETIKEHRQLVACIEARSVELAREQARIHLENAENTMMKFLSLQKENGHPLVSDDEDVLSKYRPDK